MGLEPGGKLPYTNQRLLKCLLGKLPVSKPPVRFFQESIRYVLPYSESPFIMISFQISSLD